MYMLSALVCGVLFVFLDSLVMHCLLIVTSILLSYYWLCLK